MKKNRAYGCRKLSPWPFGLVPSHAFDPARGVAPGIGVRGNVVLDATNDVLLYCVSREPILGECFVPSTEIVVDKGSCII